MKFLVEVAWSQTDHENVLVTAENDREAERKARAQLSPIQVLSIRRVNREIR